MTELYGIWDLRGTPNQNNLVRQAIDACDFPFEEMRPSLGGEGKTAIMVSWQDLSRYGLGDGSTPLIGAQAREGGNHDHDHTAGYHTVEREIEGRMRVLGLFYLPPYTRVVLDLALETRPALAQEVFLAEGAHAVDYHYMVGRGLRRDIWNALHSDDHDLAEGQQPQESGDVGHGHSWFDGPQGYSTWVGESFMAAFIKAFAPSVPVTINLSHPISVQAAADIRVALLPEVPPEPELEPVPQPEEPLHPVYWSGGNSKVVHDAHKRVEPVRWFNSLAEAEAEGFRPCRVCDPEKNI